MKRVGLMVALATLTLSLAGPAQAAGNASSGAALAGSCGGCHGADGKGKANFPPIAGMSAASFIAAMQAYKSGARSNKVMVAAAKNKSDQQIEDLAAYYASLK